ncbi:hypothetical protein JCM8097_008345 [Rhodosporidiobolus ruineniae]
MSTSTSSARNSKYDTLGITIAWDVGTADELLKLEEDKRLKRSGDNLNVWINACFRPEERQNDGHCVRLPAFAAYVETDWAGERLASFGWDDFVDIRKLISADPAWGLTTLTLRCTVTAAPLLPEPNLPQAVAPPSSALLAAYDTFFDSPALSDVCFSFGSRSTRRFIFASKRFLAARSEYFKSMFDSGFSEGNSDAAGGSDGEDRPTKRRRVPTAEAAASIWANDADGTEWLPEDWLEQHQSDAAESAEADQDEQVSPGGRTVVRVEDANYITYRAMLYWLHSEWIEFAPPASDFTVALLRMSASSPAPSSSSDSSDTDTDTITGNPPQPAASSYPSRRAFLLAQLDEPALPVEPPSPHAVYRLADKLGLEELQENAREAIVEGFTVENVLYELVSSIAYQYDEIRDAALNFAWKNWDAVSSTPAFDRVVDGAADIEGGTILLAKLMKGLKGAAP